MAKFMSLDRFAGGALLERFNLAMRQIVQNIADTNADPQKARTLTIKLTFKPDAGRSVKTSIATNVSLAPPIADETMMLIGKDARTGTVQMSEIDDASQMVSVQGNMIPVKAEVVPPAPPVQAFDPETGEIYETAAQKQQKPIDLRQM